MERGIKIEKSCINIDEHLFEMMYHKIIEKLDNVDALTCLCEELDHMLFTIYTENYTNDTGRIIEEIGNRVAFPNPIYKRVGSVNYLSTSSAETKYYRDYINVVFAVFLLLDCVKFITVHLAMERSATLINGLVRELSNKNIALVLKRISRDATAKIYEKIAELLFYKGWAKYSEISQVVQDVIFSEEDSTQRALFFSNAAKNIHSHTKYQSQLADMFYMLTKSTDRQFLNTVKTELSRHPVYDQFDKLLVQRLETIKTHNRENVFICMLIRQQTIALIQESSKINFDRDDADSIPNLLNLAQIMSGGEVTLAIEDTTRGHAAPLEPPATCSRPRLT